MKARAEAEAKAPMAKAEVGAMPTALAASALGGGSEMAKRFQQRGSVAAAADDDDDDNDGPKRAGGAVSGGCDDYRVDTSAANFGDRKCGSPQSALIAIECK